MVDVPITVLVTDVTEMHAGNYCIAGWDAAGLRMVRPLPNGANWTAALLNTNGVLPGTSIEVQPTGAASGGSFPHRSEDLVVNRSTITQVASPALDWFGPHAPPTSLSLASAYGNHLQNTGSWNGVLKGAHVAEGTVTASLVAVRLPAESLEFVPDDFDPSKLRVILTDDNASYTLPVVSHELRHIFRQGGAAAVNDHMKDVAELHVRIGLARAWQGQPGKCFAMLNGVIW